MSESRGICFLAAAAARLVVTTGSASGLFTKKLTVSSSSATRACNKIASQTYSVNNLSCPVA